MRKLAALFCLLAGPGLATGLEITVAGEAEGVILVDLFEDTAPGHVARISELAATGAYDDVVFHRVIEGFMAQTGDVQYGRAGMDMRYAGRGGSAMPDLVAEFSQDLIFERGTIGMARLGHDVDTANSQFFIMFEAEPRLDGLYTIIGEVVHGMDVVDQIKIGRGANGAVIGEPDRMVSVRVLDEDPVAPEPELIEEAE